MSFRSAIVVSVCFLTVHASRVDAGAPPARVSINEIRIAQPGDDTDEYFELIGSPGASLEGLSYVVIGDNDDGTGGSGIVECVVPLTGTIPADGYFLVVEETFCLGAGIESADLVLPTGGLNFEEDDNVTHVLVPTGYLKVGDDIDADDDGCPDDLDFRGIVRSLLALVKLNISGCPEPPSTETEFHYGPPFSIAPAGDPPIARAFLDTPFGGDWRDGLFDPALDTDTPGEPNSRFPVAPASITAVVGSSATFVADPFFGGSSQWFHEGFPVSGATASTLVIQPVTEASAGEYVFVVRLGADQFPLPSIRATLYVEGLSVVSRNEAGEAATQPSLFPVISADGRRVVFECDAANLVPGDTLGFRDIILRDTIAESVARVSARPDGAEANDFSRYPVLSSDGRFVAFSSRASNLVPGEANRLYDVFVSDDSTVPPTMVRASSSPVGQPGDAHSLWPAISADGRFVAFESRASNLVTGDTLGFYDVFVFDRCANSVRRVSVSASGGEANGASTRPSISGDGRFVAFFSSASNLVAGDFNGVSDVFVFDCRTGTTERVSVSSSGIESDGDCRRPSLSADGNRVAFVSFASNLAPGDTNGLKDIFVRDRVAGTTVRVSESTAGAQGNGRSQYPSISADGRFVVFESNARNLVSFDGNNRLDVFRHDLATRETILVSSRPDGTSGVGDSAHASVSADGSAVSFDSDVPDLAPGDANGVRDAFVRRYRHP